MAGNRVLGVILIAILPFIGFVNATAAQLGSFNDAVAQFTARHPCRDAETIAPNSLMPGRMFGCIDGRAETAKYFINEIPGSGKVENIKIMWNDWFVDIGYGLHPDQDEAEQMLKAASSIYGPAKSSELLDAFRSKRDRVIAAPGVVFSYTYRRGPKIDERLVTITPEVSRR